MDEYPDSDPDSELDSDISTPPTPTREPNEYTNDHTEPSPAQDAPKDVAPPKVIPRPYQLEMLEESLKRNIIVAMDTGSGKTQIAVLRILYELEHNASDQFIWFLAPTVSLCSQQSEYIKSQVTAVQTKLLSGSDGVDRWTQQSLWDAVLKNVKIVVSTHQILLDALTHGFVRMESLALIIFDEAHNCVGNNAGARIMQTSYREAKRIGSSVPSILGLTASPVMRSDPGSLVKIEETLDAICRTPTRHRTELQHQVNLPVLSHSYYQSGQPKVLLAGYTRPMASLGQALANLKISEDPYVLDLINQGTERSLRALDKVRMKHNTWCQKQMKSLHGTSLTICHELGAWAADNFISSAVSKFMEVAEAAGDSYQGFQGTSWAEKQYLAKALKNVEINVSSRSDVPASIPLVSDKVTKLIECIVQEPDGIFAIVFAKERAVVAELAHILSVHPAVRGRLKVGTMIGASTSSYRRNIGELLDVSIQDETLSLFKSGVVNLVVATSVLEEGIDVPACNLVICFDEPTNLKSFVQRRGRARHQESKLILLLDAVSDKLAEWQQLELYMKKLYAEEMRTLQEVLQAEDTDEGGNREFRVASTGAFLDLNNAVQHIYHFCATLPAEEFVDLTPEFICSEVDHVHVSARVILPLSVNETVRTAVSRKSWMTEKNAIRDCAFEAYVALYKAGLVNDNLLPILRHDPILEELASTAVETRASIVDVDEQLRPWVNVAKAWKSPHEIQQLTLQFGELKVRSYLPVKLPPIAPFMVYWDSNTELSVSIQRDPVAVNGDIKTASEETLSLFEAAFGARFPILRKQPAMVFTSMGPTSLREQMGRQAELGPESSYLGLIREKTGQNAPYQFRQWLPEKPSMVMVKKPYKGYADIANESPHISLTRLPRRQDFLHKIHVAESKPSEKPYSVVLPASWCTVDDLAFEYVQFALVIPSIMHRLELYLLANILCTTMLLSVGIRDIDLAKTAISASSAQGGTDYQRLEFFGDMALKFCTAVQLMAEHPLWHEGNLSAQKDRLVANSRLSRAARETGLDKFIVTKAFTGRKWRPLYVEELLELPTGAQRSLSTKVLADVVEALIGAAIVDGGMAKALACLRIFLPELDWQPLEARRASLFETAPDVALPATLRRCEELVGYEFKKKSLLVEALTHGSCNSGAGSLERLEFLGDSVLDRIITTILFEQEPELSQFQMHLMRTALVNADFLGFMCMEWAIPLEVTDIIEAGGRFHQKPTATRLPFWRFMRHHSPKLGAAQAATARRHAELRGPINAALTAGGRYPWALLARLQARKFYSDIVESLLGAVWIDTGSLDACRGVVERMGILAHLRRLLADGVHVWHPKEEIGVLADTRRVEYDVERRGGEYRCTVSVGGVAVAAVGGGVSVEEVKTKAATMAIEGGVDG